MIEWSILNEERLFDRLYIPGALYCIAVYITVSL